MHIVILVWSHRNTSQSTKVGAYITQSIATDYVDVSTYTYDLAWNPLPLWSEGMWDNESDFYKETQPIRAPVAEELEKADALVVISPEWSGMATPGVKNFFLYANAKLLANKPGLIVSVSAWRGWRYPIAELRMSSTKNTQLCYIPQHVIVDHVEEVLNQDVVEWKADEYIRARLAYSIRMLHAYAVWLQHVRASGVMDMKKYAYGM